MVKISSDLSGANGGRNKTELLPRKWRWKVYSFKHIRMNDGSIRKLLIH